MKRVCRKLIGVLCMGAVALVVVACGGRKGGGSGAQEFDKVIYSPRYAGGFEIVGAEGRESSLIKIRNPWQGAEEVTTSLLILRNGEAAPPDYEGQVVVGDVERVICMSSSYVAMIGELGKVESVVGVSGIDFINNPYVAAHHKEIGDVGYDSNVNYELMVALEPDVVLLYGVTGASTMEPKLRELGIPFAYVGEYLEEDPLGKTEWLVAVGEMMGVREAAEEIFEAIPLRYEALRERAAEAQSAKPRVMINTPYADTWFMASEQSYVARLIADAGGDYIYRKNKTNTSLPIDMEEAALLTSEADVWINLGAVNSLEDLRRQFPRYADVECVRSGAVFNNDLRLNPMGGNDYWESGVVRPDLILQDLVKIFHPELAEDVEFSYYHRLE